MDQLAQKRLIELRNDPTDVRVVGEHLHALEDRGDESLADRRYPLVGVPCLDACQVAERGLSEAKPRPTRYAMFLDGIGPGRFDDRWSRRGLRD